METEEILFISWLEETFGQGHTAATGVSISSPNKSTPATSLGMKSITGCPSTGWILLHSNWVIPNFGLLSKNKEDKFSFFPQEIIFKGIQNSFYNFQHMHNHITHHINNLRPTQGSTSNRQSRQIGISGMVSWLLLSLPLVAVLYSQKMNFIH